MPLKVFFCYAREDEALLNKLKSHLRPLQRQGLIDVWHDRDISAGTEWEREISEHLKAAEIILLLVSPDFMNSDYCYSIEMKQALERHNRQEARVIPIILRHVYWQGVLGRIQALPKDSLPVTDPDWFTIDRALHNVTEGIRKAVEELTNGPNQRTLPTPGWMLPDQASPPPGSESSLRQSPQPILSTELVTSPSQSASQPIILPSGASHTPTGISRRAALRLGLTGLAVVGVASGSLVWLAYHLSPSAPVVQTSPTIPPTPLSVGTTLYTYQRHSDKVCAVAWSPDGRRIASGSYDYTVQVWDAGDGGNVYIYRGHSSTQSGVYAVTWSPDGKRIASGSEDKTVHVWDAANGGNVYTYHGHSNFVLANFVLAVAWSHDGRRIASGSWDKTVQVWDAANGTLVYTYRGHSASVWAVAWSPDSKRVASGSEDKMVQVWDAANGGNVYTYHGHSDLVRSVAWSPDGRRIASGSWDKTVQVWDAV